MKRLALPFLALAACAHPTSTSTSTPTPTSTSTPTSTPTSLPTPPPPDANAKPIRVLLYGDFGAVTPQRDAVAAAMSKVAQRDDLDLAIAVGDNLYDCGPNPHLANADQCRFEADGNSVAAGYDPPRDPLFDVLFERPLHAFSRKDGTPVPVYLALGNHDAGFSGKCGPGHAWNESPDARTRTCLEVARRVGRWHMPGRHYVVDEGPARFVFFDSDFFEVGDYGGFKEDEELAWLKSAVEGCGGRMCFVVCHHPSYTAGVHKKQAREGHYLETVKKFEAVLAAHPIDAWIAGHDHDLQHLRAPAGYDIFVSGNTSKGRPNEPFETGASSPGAKVLFASDAWGFAVLELRPGHWSVRFEDVSGKPLHCCEAVSGGHCEPTPCGASPSP